MSDNQTKVPVGAVLGGKFRITREIGRGGMAQVYEAENITIGKRVAVKVLAQELLTSRVVKERFIREARAAAAIRSPHICDVYDTGEFDDRPFLVMELLEGESLYEHMTRVRRMDAESTLTIATQVCRGLTQAHEAGVIHRDLKPENIFLTTSPDGELTAKIVDFGLAKFYAPTGGDAAQARLTREGALFGTPAYMSPEQAKGQGEVDLRADLWALGCIVYECVTGQTVWNVDQGVAMILAQIAGAPLPRPTRLRPDLPRTFDAWFERALDRDASKRFQTARELADALQAAFKPSTPSKYELPRPASQEEIQGVDELLDPESLPQPGVPSSGPRGSGPRATPPASGPAPQPSPALVAAPAPPTGSGAGRAIAGLLAATALAVGGYGVWLYVLHPPGTAAPARPVASAQTSASAEPAASAAPSSSVALDTDPPAAVIGDAQSALAKGDRDKALAGFKDAFGMGGTGVARGFLAQAGIALIDNPSKCKITGLGRPRPFDNVTLVSRPTLAVTATGIVAAWVDNHADARRRQAFSVTLDPALKRSSPVRLITPESESVRHVQLIALQKELALLWWDESPANAGVYVRLLGADGRISGPAQKLSGARSRDFSPALAQAKDGSVWVVWSEEAESGATDLMARHLSATLEPTADAVRLTAYTPSRGLEVGAEQPDVAWDHDRLVIVFAARRDTEAQIALLVALESEVIPKNNVVRPSAKERANERHVGKLTIITTRKGKTAQPRVSCGSEGCFAAWDDEKAGTYAAYVDAEKAVSIWHKEFARRGSRPEVSSDARGRAVVSWFESSRVKIARVTRDGLEEASTIARVSGFQPYPELCPGPQPGSWLTAWRDYESGHLEAYVVRAECPE